VLIEACLNGARTAAEHPAIPRTPRELAAEAHAAVEGGARVLHLHPYDDDGLETLAAQPCAAALQAVRAACPGVPISLSTSAAIEPDPRRRLELIAGWTLQPELVTANQGEAGILEVCQLLVYRGVGIEAGLLSLADAHEFVRAGIADSCVRVLVEPLDADPDTAVGHAAAMEQVLLDAGIKLEQVHHGDMLASWHVVARAIARGHGIRAGLEDSTVLPDGQLAPGNGALVRAAVKMLERPSG
jgi:uncharacterized protein (DUF849 family)